MKGREEGKSSFYLTEIYIIQIIGQHETHSVGRTPTKAQHSAIAGVTHVSQHLKSGYIEFAWLESSADATSAVMLSPAVSMAAELPPAVADNEPQLP